ncbi:MAG: hypothetical protein ACK504_01725 [Bacteroidota bacterium]
MDFADFLLYNLFSNNCLLIEFRLINNIGTTGNIITTAGDITTSSGDISTTTGNITGVGLTGASIIATQTMTAINDLNVGGNTNVGGLLTVTNGLDVTTGANLQGVTTISGATTLSGNTSFSVNTLINGNITLANLPSYLTFTADAAPQLPCDISTLNPLFLSTNGTLFNLPASQVDLINQSMAINLDDPCATKAVPVYPFTWQTYGNNVPNNAQWIGTKGNFNFNIRTNSIPRMVVKGNGNILFGLKSILPSHLHANSQFQFDGKVACKEFVVVDPSKWADFVFDTNYKLLPLSEVEYFYTKNKHLPSVPSEKEVKQNGINTAEIDAILLQKIEELTLYLVQQQKEIETLKQMIKK